MVVKTSEDYNKAGHVKIIAYSYLQSLESDFEL